MLAATGSVAADEPLPKGFEGSFKLEGSHGYKIQGIIASTGKGTAGVLILGARKKGTTAEYFAKGEVTAERVDFDLGALGSVEAEVRSTGREETVHSDCGGKSLTVPGQEYVGTIELRGEEGFTVARADRAKVEFKPLLDLVCPGLSSGGSSGEGLRGVQLKVKRIGVPSLLLDQNHPGAPVSYEASMAEKRGGILISRSASGHLGAGALGFEPDLSTATFAAGAPFSGTASYLGKRPPREVTPGTGTWRGNLKIDFPGDAGVRLAGPGFTASVIHARRTESNG
jgi:hypothetical protein